MNIKNLILLLSIGTCFFFQSCSEKPDTVFEEEQVISNKKVKDVEVLGRLTSSSSAKTTNIRKAARIRVQNIINVGGGKRISSLNKRRISRCPRSTSADSYFAGSPGDQRNGVSFYYTLDPNNRNWAFIVTKMCKSGNKVFATEYVKDDFAF